MQMMMSRKYLQPQHNSLIAKYKKTGHMSRFFISVHIRIASPKTHQGYFSDLIYLFHFGLLANLRWMWLWKLSIVYMLDVQGL